MRRRASPPLLHLALLVSSNLKHLGKYSASRV